MSNVYYQGDNIFLYAKFNTEIEQEVIDFAQVRILHEKDGLIYEDLPWTNMENMGGNEYFHNFKLSMDCDLGEYKIIYIGKSNDKEAIIMENIHAISRNQNHINYVKIYGYVYDIRTGLPINESCIEVYERGTKIYQSSTNEVGNWETYLYPGEYTFKFSKFTYMDCELIAQIGDEHNELQFDSIGLESESAGQKGKGVFTIKDKMVLKNGQPLVGLNVSISYIVSPKDIIAKDTTNEEGEWECYLDEGDYLLKINGNAMGKGFDKTLRLKVNDNGNHITNDLSQNTATLTNMKYIGPGQGLIKVTDIIKDKNGNPIVDVQVNILNPKNSNDIIAQTYTSISGQWELNLDPGNYTIEYYHPKFKTITDKLVVK